jgi:DNA helicase-2/ATP-dependent DNA helicase PcrA
VKTDVARILAGLNDRQREAVLHTDGPLLVLAGAGSGKTRVITSRIARLLSLGVEGKEILAVTFTNKAAAEMRERVRGLVGQKSASGVRLSTFHSFGLSLLRAERQALGFDQGFVVYDTADQLGVVREILRHKGVAERRLDAKALLARVSRWKEAMREPARPDGEGDGQGPDTYDEYDDAAAEVLPLYRAALRRFHAVDFDDLVLEPIRLLEEDGELRQRWQARFRYLLVDEYQDTNAAQLRLLGLLAGVHKNLCVVGDDDQSIYAFRGADRKNVLEFERVFEGARVVLLEENYRSTPTILDAANAVIKNNKDRREKNLFRRAPRGEPIIHAVVADGEAEARFVAEEIDAMRARGLRPSEAAILYRSNNQARAFEEELRTRGLHYVVVGGQSFYERKEVKDLIAYLRVALHPRDELSLRRVLNYPARGLGDVAVARLEEHARSARVPLLQALERADEIPDLVAKSGQAAKELAALFARTRVALVDDKQPAAEVTRRLVTDIGLEDDLRGAAPSAAAARRRLDNVEDFINQLARHTASTLPERSDGNTSSGARRAGESEPGASALYNYLCQLSLASRDDDDGKDDDRLTLTTFHGAKGREWRVVFLVGLEEQLLPHARTLNPIATDVVVGDGAIDLDEERRLLYVGITRAREVLYLTRAHNRAGRGATRLASRTPSRFLAEIPAELTELRDLASGESEEASEELARNALADLLRLADE